MPDPSEPTPDELVAAYVDGEATPDEVTQVESNPELMAYVDTFRALADLVGSPPEPATIDPDLRDRHIATALGASSTADNVTSLVAARRPWYRRPITAVAAVIVAVALAVPLIAQLGNENDGDIASTEPTALADEATDASTDDGAAAGDATDLSERALTRTTPAPFAAEAFDAAGEESATGDAGDGGSAAASIGPDLVLGRVLAAEGDAFISVADAAAAYDDLLSLLEDDDANLAPVYEIVETDQVARQCLSAFGISLIVVAEVDDTSVVIGRANNETLVLDAQTCEQLFPD